MDKYVVIGNPVEHSLSPAIHARFAAITGERLEYTKLLATDFARDTTRFFAEGGKGASVTLPFKVEAFELAASTSARASQAGAANFLVARDGGLHADNTDGAGLVADLEANLGVQLQGAALLLLGAGGAARGVIAPLLARAPSSLVVANRTESTARDLAARFASLGAIEGAALGAIPVRGYDVVINATSTSTRGESLDLPAHAIAPGAVAYDMAYGAAARAFTDRARNAGARASDGLGMLVEQAAEAFWLWRGVRPPTGEVLAELRARNA